MKSLTLLWVASLIIIAALTSSFMRVQAAQHDARILSGPDIGFRVEGVDRAGNPTGTFMVRVKGKWLEANSKLALRPATE